VKNKSWDGIKSALLMDIFRKYRR